VTIKSVLLAFAQNSAELYRTGAQGAAARSSPMRQRGRLRDGGKDKTGTLPGSYIIIIDNQGGYYE